MSKGTRERFEQTKASPPDPPAAPDPPAPPVDEQLDADGEPKEPDAGAGEEPGDVETTPLGQLRRLTAAQDLEISDDGATLYLAYLEARAKAHPKNPLAKYPPDPVAYARELRRSSPHVWSQIKCMNFVGLARALELHGLPAVNHNELQAASTAIRTAKPA